MLMCALEDWGWAINFVIKDMSDRCVRAVI